MADTREELYADLVSQWEALNLGGSAKLRGIALGPKDNPSYARLWENVRQRFGKRVEGLSLPERKQVIESYNRFERDLARYYGEDVAEGVVLPVTGDAAPDTSADNPADSVDSGTGGEASATDSVATDTADDPGVDPSEHGEAEQLRQRVEGVVGRTRPVAPLSEDIDDAIPAGQGLTPFVSGVVIDDGLARQVGVDPGATRAIAGVSTALSSFLRDTITRKLAAAGIVFKGEIKFGDLMNLCMITVLGEAALGDVKVSDDDMIVLDSLGALAENSHFEDVSQRLDEMGEQLDKVVATTGHIHQHVVAGSAADFTTEMLLTALLAERLNMSGIRAGAQVEEVDVVNDKITGLNTHLHEQLMMEHTRRKRSAGRTIS